MIVCVRFRASNCLFQIFLDNANECTVDDSLSVQFVSASVRNAAVLTNANKQILDQLVNIVGTCLESSFHCDSQALRSDEKLLQTNSASLLPLHLQSANIVLLNGPKGSGKSTVVNALTQRVHIAHNSVSVVRSNGIDLVGLDERQLQSRLTAPQVTERCLIVIDDFVSNLQCASTSLISLCVDSEDPGSYGVCLAKCILQQTGNVVALYLYRGRFIPCQPHCIVPKSAPDDHNQTPC